MDNLDMQPSVAHTKADPGKAYGRPPEFGEGFSAKAHAELEKAGRQPPLLKLGVAICIKAEPPYLAY